MNYKDLQDAFLGLTRKPASEDKETPNERRIKIMSGLMKRGISERDAVAIAANSDVETGGTFDPKTKQRGVGKVKDEDWFKKSKAGRGTGIIQWDGVRQRNLKKYADEQGTSWDDMETQLDFLANELQTTEKSGMAKVKKAESIEDKTKAFAKYVERPGKPHMKKRVKAANKIQDKIIEAKSSYFGGPVLPGPRMHPSIEELTDEEIEKMLKEMK